MNRRTFISTSLVVAPFALRRLSAQPLKRVGLPMSFAGKPIPVFQNGFLIGFDPDEASIQLIDNNGHFIRNVRIAVPDAVSAIVYAAGASAQGRIVAAIGAKDNSGRIASALAFLTPDGKTTKLVRTTPFAAAQVAVLPDGRVLCLGREHDDEYEDVKGYHVMRFYSPEGALLGKALSVNTLAVDRKQAPPHSWMLSTNAQRIALFNHRDHLQYIETDHKGAVVRSLSDLGASRSVSGLALLLNGDRLVSTTTNRVYSLERVTDSTGSRSVRKAQVALPSDVDGLKLLGVSGSEVAALSLRNDQLVFFDQASIF